MTASEPPTRKFITVGGYAICQIEAYAEACLEWSRDHIDESLRFPPWICSLEIDADEEECQAFIDQVVQLMHFPVTPCWNDGECPYQVAIDRQTPQEEYEEVIS